MLMVIYCYLFGTQTQAEPPWPDEHLLIVALQWQTYQFSDAILLAQNDQHLYLPLEAFSTALEYPIQVDSEHGKAQGRFDSRELDLHLQNGTLTLQGKALAYPKTHLQWREDGIWIHLDLLSQLAPVDFELDSRNSILHLKPRKPLPIIVKHERQQKRAQLKTPQGPTDEPTSPFNPSPYRPLSWPALNLTLNTSVVNKPTTRITPSLSLNGVSDLGGMTGNFALSSIYDPSQGLQLDHASLLLDRRDASSGLLGPLRATHIQFGDISSPNHAYVGQTTTGLGFKINNHPLNRPAQFDRIDLQGPLLPGWEVELYRDSQLIDFRDQPKFGRYHFEDLPLYYGANHLRLVFYGPQGQQEEIVHDLPVDGQLLQPGKTHYQFAVNRIDAKALPLAEQTHPNQHNRPRIFSEILYGLNRHISLRAHTTSLYVEGSQHHYLGTAARLAFGSSTLDTNFVADSEGGTFQSLRYQSRMLGFRINAEYLAFQDFVSERVSQNGLLNRAQLRINRGFRVAKNRLNLSLNASDQVLKNGHNQRQINQSIALDTRRFNLTHNLLWRLDDNPAHRQPHTFLGSSLLGNVRFRGVRLRSSLNWQWQPRPEFQSASLNLNLPLGSKTQIQSGLHHNLKNDQTRMTANLNHSLKRLTIAGGFSHQGGSGLSLNVGLSTRFAREPRQRHWHQSSEDMLQAPMVSARVFIDDNQNGRFDTGEVPISGVLFKVDNLTYKTPTDDMGIVLLKQLPVHQAFTITLVKDSITDPDLAARVDRRSSLGRPSHVITMDFPVLPIGEVEGSVFRKGTKGQRALSGVILHLINDMGQIVATTKSEYDGFFLFQNVPLGHYQLRLDQDQIERHNLNRKPHRNVAIDRPGQVVILKNLVLDL